MAFIDQDFIDVSIGAPMREKFTQGRSDYLTKMILRADGRTKSSLKSAGYTLDPATTTPALTPTIVKEASLGNFIRMGCALRAIPLPDQFGLYTDADRAIREGELIPDGLTADPTEGVGGSLFSSSDEDDLNGYPPQLSIPKTRVW